MTLKIDVSASDCRSANCVMAEIAKAQGWENKGRVPDTQFLYNVVVEDGRKGTYDVVYDELELEDGENGYLFSDMINNNWYRGETFNEFMDVPGSIWGETEDGRMMLCVE